MYSASVRVYAFVYAFVCMYAILWPLRAMYTDSFGGHVYDTWALGGSAKLIQARTQEARRQKKSKWNINM